MRKVEVVAVLQLDAKPKGTSFWSSTACRQLLIKPLLAVGPAGRASCSTVSAKEGLQPSLLLRVRPPVPEHTAAARSPYASAKAIQILAFPALCWPQQRYRSTKTGMETAGPVVLQNA